MLALYDEAKERQNGPISIITRDLCSGDGGCYPGISLIEKAVISRKDGGRGGEGKRFSKSTTDTALPYGRGLPFHSETGGGLDGAVTFWRVQASPSTWLTPLRCKITHV